MTNKEIDILLKPSRDKIDLIDRKMLSLLSERFSEVEEIGRIKKENNLLPLQKARFESLLKKLSDYGKAIGIKPSFISDIWNRIHKEAIKLEE